MLHAPLHRLRAQRSAVVLPVKTITPAGSFRFGKRLLCVANSLTDQRIGLEETDDGLLAVCFHTVLFAACDEREYIIQSWLTCYRCCRTSVLPTFPIQAPRDPDALAGHDAARELLKPCPADAPLSTSTASQNGKGSERGTAEVESSELVLSGQGDTRLRHTA